MADIKSAYGTSNQTITVSLASLADSATAGRESTVIDNTSNVFLDALVTGKIKPQNSGSIIAPSAVYVWAYGTTDNGTTYPDTVTGSDAAITMNSPNQLRLLGVINVIAINTTYIGGPWSVASCFGGRLPQKWGIVVQNDCGTALSATGGDHVFQYQGVYQTVT
jgi:hypothetical protein